MKTCILRQYIFIIFIILCISIPLLVVPWNSFLRFSLDLEIRLTTCFHCGDEVSRCNNVLLCSLPLNCCILVWAWRKKLFKLNSRNLIHFYATIQQLCAPSKPSSSFAVRSIHQLLYLKPCLLCGWNLLCRRNFWNWDVNVCHCSTNIYYIFQC